MFESLLHHRCCSFDRFSVFLRSSFLSFDLLLFCPSFPLLLALHFPEPITLLLFLWSPSPITPMAFLTTTASFCCSISFCHPLHFPDRIILPVFSWVGWGQKSEADSIWGAWRWHWRRHHWDWENQTRWDQHVPQLERNLKSFFGIPGQEKERPEDVTIYSEMIKLNQDTSFDYFVGEFQIFWMIVQKCVKFSLRVTTSCQPLCWMWMEGLDQPRLPQQEVSVWRALVVKRRLFPMETGSVLRDT